MTTSGVEIPAIPDVLIDDPDIRNILLSLKQIAEIREGRRGDVNQRFISYYELIDYLQGNDKITVEAVTGGHNHDTLYSPLGHSHAHNNLTSIDGGTPGEYFHLTSAQHTSFGTLTGGGDASLLHYHSSLKDSGEEGVKYTAGGSVQLDYNNIKSLTTQVGGIDVFDSTGRHGMVYFVGGKMTLRNDETAGTFEFYMRDNTGNPEPALTLNVDSGHDFYVKSSLGVKIVQTGLWIMGGSQALSTIIDQTGNNFSIQNMENSGTIAIKGRLSGGSYVNTIFATPDAGVSLWWAGALQAAVIDDGFRISTGILTLPETTTPTADPDEGKFYCKADNKAYFQDGAGAEHELAFV